MIELALNDLFGAPVRRPRRHITKPLRGVQANAGIEAAYRRKLVVMIEEMAKDVRKTLVGDLRDNPPAVVELAQDDLSSTIMRDAIRKLARRWNKRFDTMAERLAKYFAKSTSQRVDGALERILKEGGMSVEWRMTPAMRDVLNATVAENVGLIKSIPAQYLGRVEGFVMRSVTTGRDLKQLSDDLQKQLGVEKRRAHLIARDQNNKCSAAFTRVRQIESFGDEAMAVWCHSGAGKEPRPTHVKAGRDKVQYKVSEGWFDPAIGRNTWPGVEINCRCFSKIVVPGFS